MKNPTHLFFLATLITLTAIIGFLAGALWTKSYPSEPNLEAVKNQAMEKFAEQIKTLPVYQKAAKPADNLLSGEIKNLGNDFLILKIKPQTVDQLLPGNKNKRKISITSTTEIFQTTVNSDINLSDPKNYNKVVNKDILKFSDLQSGNQVYITIDPQNKNQQLVVAKKIELR
ncbi:MAG TPA: hypothetical protein VKP03_01215 [Patescibacteria group bacterium]|nr:hypothetical protein [Patescibacteria group bacterium]